MKWVRSIVNTIKPGFGGIATFCEDPDGLLDIPEVREAIRAEGMTISDWDGSPQALMPLQDLSESDKPVIIVPDGPYRHVVDGVLSGYAWHNISIGGLFNKFSYEIVKSVPRQYWEQLKALHQITLRPQNADDTATLIARAIYGADPLHLQIGNGWIKLLVEVSDSSEGLPRPIADALARYAPDWLNAANVPDLLVDPAAARGALAVLNGKQPELIDGLGASAKAKVSTAEREKPKATCRQQPKKLSSGISMDATAEYVLGFGQLYCDELTKSSIDESSRLQINSQFATWLEKNYALVLPSHNPNVLRLSNLLDRLDSELGDDRLLLLVVDALGMVLWNIVAAQWVQDGLISRADTRAAFAMLPTVTSLSRRALFEGKPPSQFSPGDHSQKLERSLWKTKFGDNAAYFSASEKLGISDSFALGKSRVCVVDIAWDKLAHSADPDFHSLQELATSWATKTELRSVIAEARKSGYRVVITADHGIIGCCGIGRPNVGELTDERSKRVLLFNKPELRDGLSSQSECYNRFQPPGLPPTCCPLFANGISSFDHSGVRSYSHGGLSIEEVLVPVAEVFGE